jgi:hypothetical protein
MTGWEEGKTRRPSWTFSHMEVVTGGVKFVNTVWVGKIP